MRQSDLDVLREPSRIPLAFLRGLNKKSSTLKNFVFKKISAKLQNTGPLLKRVSLEWLGGSPVAETGEPPSH